MASNTQTYFEHAVVFWVSRIVKLLSDEDVADGDGASAVVATVQSVRHRLYQQRRWCHDDGCPKHVRMFETLLDIRGRK